MSHESDADRTISVADDEVRVEKSFVDDEFPVPAIKFQLTSESDGPAHVRLVDQIPEDFPMEGVGFHPDYESDNWTAYKDHRVEYERTLDPGEEATTVYGIRLEQASDVDGFLGEPILERPPAPEDGGDEDVPRDVEDILGTDRSQLVRDALQGNGRLAAESVAEPEPEAPAADEEVTEEPTTADGPTPRRVLDADLTPASRRREEGKITAVGSGESEAPTEEGVQTDAQAVVEEEAEPVAEVDDGEEAEPGTEIDEEAELNEETAGEDAAPGADVADGEIDGDAASDDVVEEHVDSPGAVSGEEAERTPTQEASPVDVDGGLAATLAAEIRSGEVAESDLETLRGELDVGLPRSADVRIRRLQAQMEDLNAYADAIAEFIDEEGTGAELVERLDTELSEITDELDDLRESVDTADAERADLRESVERIDADLDDVDERLGEVAGELDDVAEEAEDAAAGVDELHDRADGIEERLNRTADRIDEVDSAVRDVSADVEDVEADVDDVAEEVENVASDIDETSAHVSRLDEEMGDVREDIAAVDGDVVDARESLEAELDDLRAEVSALSAELDRIGSIEREIEELQQFRDRVNSAFGPGE